MSFCVGLVDYFPELSSGFSFSLFLSVFAKSGENSEKWWTPPAIPRCKCNSATAPPIFIYVSLCLFPLRVSFYARGNPATGFQKQYNITPIESGPLSLFTVEISYHKDLSLAHTHRPPVQTEMRHEVLPHPNPTFWVFNPRFTFNFYNQNTAE